MRRGVVDGGRLVRALIMSVQVAVGSVAGAQEVAAQEGGGANEGAVSARPEDVSTIDGVVSALYESLSGGVGVPRQWDRFRSLYHPAARIWHTDGLTDGVAASPRPVTVEQYISAVGYAERLGFRETEVQRSVKEYGTIAQVFSTYEYETEEGSMKAGGINGFQLFFDGTRYWIMSGTWSAETPTSPIPTEHRGDAIPEVISELLPDLEDISGKFVALAREVPEEEYGFSPEDGVRSIGEVFAHVAVANVVILTRGGAPFPDGPVAEWIENPDLLANKNDIVEALAAGFDFLRSELETTSSDDLERRVDLLGRSSTYRATLTFALAHAHEHLGQSIAYARFRGITPPWS